MWENTGHKAIEDGHPAKDQASREDEKQRNGARKKQQMQGEKEGYQEGQGNHGLGKGNGKKQQAYMEVYPHHWVTDKAQTSPCNPEHIGGSTSQEVC